jgi:uncharacterized protein
MLRISLTLAYSVLMLAMTIWITVRTTRPDFSRDRTRAPTQSTATPYRDTAWQELMPADWSPNQEIQTLQRGMRFVSDDSPTAREGLRQMRERWAQAPADTRLAGRSVRLRGYVVPLDMHGQGMTEFLLVPYAGACIHAPPPPANQIVRVILPAAHRQLKSMDAVHVSGVLQVEHAESQLGSSSYAMHAERIEPYVH